LEPENEKAENEEEDDDTVEIGVQKMGTAI
jgi:hypothetical protein